MHWVGGSGVVFDNDSDRVVVAVVADVPLGVKGVRGVAQVSEEEDRVVVVGAEGGFVHVPEQMAGAICMDSDSNLVGCGGVRGGWEGKKWDGRVEGVVTAVGIVKGCGDRGRDRIGIGAIVIDRGQGYRLTTDTAGFADG